jgi:hypothetical protein
LPVQSTNGTALAIRLLVNGSVKLKGSGFADVFSVTLTFLLSVLRLAGR